MIDERDDYPYVSPHLYGIKNDSVSNDPVAQLVEHLTFNQVVAGSNPARITTLRFLSFYLRCFSSLNLLYFC